MKKSIIKRAAAALSAAMVIGAASLLAGFAGSSQGYTEETVSIPDSIDYVSELRAMPDGSISLIGGSRSENEVIRLVSEDNGKTWAEEERYVEKLGLGLDDKSLVEGFGYVSDDGYTGLFVCIFDRAEYMGNDNKGEIDEVCRNYIINPEGQITEFTTDVNAYQMCFEGDKTYISDIRGNIYSFDKDQGKVTGVTETDVWSPLFAADSKTKKTVYDYADRNENWCNIAVASKEGQHFIADETGIYEICGDSVVKLYDGKNSRLSESGFIEGLAVSDDGTLIAATGDETGNVKIVRYRAE